MSHLLRSIENDINSPETKWESATPKDALVHFTGRGSLWIIQLVCLGTHRMGTASSMRAGLVVKLDDELTEMAEKKARAYFQ